MTKKIRFPLSPLHPLQVGHVWELRDSFLRIGEVGKRLVHYRQYKGKEPRGPSSLSSKRDLEKFLTVNKAILVQE